MKKSFILFIQLMLISIGQSCFAAEPKQALNSEEKQLSEYEEPKVIELGDLKSKEIFVYLCGLTANLYTDQEIQNRKLLNLLGKKLNIKFLAITPLNRNPERHNLLYWPHDTQAETSQTYQQIVDATNQQKIAGFIGFSNGGFLLNDLAQIIELNVPIISIGAAGDFKGGATKNTIYLLIGKQDIHHYKYAKQFYNDSKHSSLKVKLIKYPEGHIIPEKPLEKILSTIKK